MNVIRYALVILFGIFCGYAISRDSAIAAALAAAVLYVRVLFGEFLTEHRDAR